MTDIAVREETTLAEFEQGSAPAPVARTRDLVAWAEEARAAHNIATSLAQTSFAPAQFRGKPGECTAAILTGNEMGLSPMASLRAFDLIQGTPAMRANAMRGVVQSRGHQIWAEAISPTKVAMCGRRLGEEHVHRSEWTIQRAEKLGLTGKDNWRKQPQAMLVARATAEVCRMTASDVLYGVPYSSEELADGTADEAPVKRKARRRMVAEAPSAPEPEFPEPQAGTEPASDEEPTEAPAPEWPETAQPGGAS